MKKLSLMLAFVAALIMCGQAHARLQWLDVEGGAVPTAAVRGGNSGNRALYICRGYYHDGVHAGKLFEGRCLIGWGGREVALDQYQVLAETDNIVWRGRRNSLPGHAVRGGHAAGKNLYVCRAEYQGVWHPGKLYQGRCLIGWGGKEISFDSYQVLTARQVRWRRMRAGEPAPGLVAAGREDGRGLFVCRGRYKNGVHPGKLWEGRCLIGWGGKEVALRDYEVLTFSDNLRWRNARGGGWRSTCVRGGKVGGQSQCVCRVKRNDGWHPGKTHQGRCNFGWGGREVSSADFEVLVHR